MYEMGPEEGAHTEDGGLLPNREPPKDTLDTLSNTESLKPILENLGIHTS